MLGSYCSSHSQSHLQSTEDIWAWLKIKGPGLRVVLVFVSIYQAKPFWGYPIFEPQPHIYVYIYICNIYIYDILYTKQPLMLVGSRVSEVLPGPAALQPGLPGRPAAGAAGGVVFARELLGDGAPGVGQRLGPGTDRLRFGPVGGVSFGVPEKEGRTCMGSQHGWCVFWFPKKGQHGWWSLWFLSEKDAEPTGSL